MGLNHSLKNAELWIKKILQEGFDVGMYGISSNNFGSIKNEYEIFKNLSGSEKFGIRIHYLRFFKDMLGFLSETGYLFDSTLYRFENPFKTKNLWELPLHIMDGRIFYKNSRWQNQTLKQAQEKTERIIEGACKKGVRYYTILFHDRHFSNSFKTWERWYMWLVNYLKNNGLEFINYSQATKEMEEVEH